MENQQSRKDSVQIEDLPAPAQSLTPEEASEVVGGIWKRGTFKETLPTYEPPKVISDDGINIQTSDPSTSNVGYDSPFTPIPS